MGFVYKHRNKILKLPVWSCLNWVVSPPSFEPQEDELPLRTRENSLVKAAHQCDDASVEHSRSNRGACRCLISIQEKRSSMQLP